MANQYAPRTARRRAVAAVLVLLLLTLAAGCGQGSGQGDTQNPAGDTGQAGESAVTVTGAWARPAPKGEMSAAFFVIENQGSEAVRLTGVRTDVATTAEIHETVQEGSTARMQRVDGIDVPAGGRVELAPGGYHVMLMDLQRDLNAGDSIDLVLEFADGQEVTVTAEVRDAPAGGHDGGH